LTSTLNVRPSPTRVPAAFLPSQVTAHEVSDVTDHDRTSVVPFQMRAVPDARSFDAHESRTVSAAPSPLGEKLAGEAAWVTAGRVVSTLTGYALRALLPAWSHATSVAW
jgi:hypothetical protein